MFFMFLTLETDTVRRPSNAGGVENLGVAVSQRGQSGQGQESHGNHLDSRKKVKAKRSKYYHENSK